MKQGGPAAQARVQVVAGVVVVVGAAVDHMDQAGVGHQMQVGEAAHQMTVVVVDYMMWVVAVDQRWEAVRAVGPGTNWGCGIVEGEANCWDCGIEEVDWKWCFVM